MGPLLSAFCDGELGGREETPLREHLRACASCRATLRAYRAAPRAVAALAPALPLDRSLLERAHDALAGLAARFGGGGASADTALSQVAGGGAGGVGAAALAKVAAVCIGTAGGAAACVATGVVPAPLDLGRQQAKAPALERPIKPIAGVEPGSEQGVEYEVAPQPVPSEPPPEPARDDAEPAVQPPAPSGAVEYTPPEPAPAPEPVSEPGPSGPGGGNPAGEFGP
jgi:Putative zinc-finger